MVSNKIRQLMVRIKTWSENLQFYVQDRIKFKMNIKNKWIIKGIEMK